MVTFLFALTDSNINSLISKHIVLPFADVISSRNTRSKLGCMGWIDPNGYVVFVIHPRCYEAKVSNPRVQRSPVSEGSVFLVLLLTAICQSQAKIAWPSTLDQYP